MDRIEAALEKYRKSTWIAKPLLDEIDDVLAGKRGKLSGKHAKEFHAQMIAGDCLKALGGAVESERDQRVLQLAAATRAYGDLAKLVEARLAREQPGEDSCAPVLAGFLAAEASPVDAAQFLIDHISGLANSQGPTSAGRYLLACAEGDLHLALLPHSDGYSDAVFNSAAFVDLLARHDSHRVTWLASTLVAARRKVGPQALVAILRVDPARFEADVLRILELEKTWQRFFLTQALYEFDPTRYRELTLTAVRAVLAENPNPGMLEWIAKAFGAEAIPLLTTYVENGEGWARPKALDALAKHGAAATAALLAGLTPSKKPRKEWRPPDHSTWQTALGHLIALRDPAHDQRIEAELVVGLAGPGIEEIIATLRLAGRWDAKRIEEHIWSLLAHKSKQVREAAARVLAKQGDSAVARASALFGQRSADTRAAAVTLLVALGTEAAQAALEARVDQEGSDDVRDQILLGLEEAWQRSGRNPTREDVQKRIARAMPRLAEPAVKWLDETKLPPLQYVDGEEVDATTVRYLLYRQSRAKEIRPDVEAKPLYGFLDRKSSGPFAQVVLDGFLTSGADASNRWALTIAGLLGADALVPKLNAMIRDWVDQNRGKLAEYAVQALALMGSDVALAAVDALAIRYRTKMKNVGRAAEEAFAAAAESCGIEPDELADRVAPWLGFEPGKPRVIEDGKLRVSVTIGTDFKLRFMDLEKGKRLSSLPKSAPKPIAAEMKDLAAILRESAKAQIMRMEGLLVRQRRWPVARWRELFLDHPLLRPFSVRLVWGGYDGAGKLQATFRALEDGSLTTAADDEHPLSPDGTIGIVHPLELEEALATAWRAHLGDHEVEPPFPQLDRPVVFVEDADRPLRVLAHFAATNLNALTFKGRAERRGWRRGSVVDGGGVTCYRKSFLAANVEVILFIDGLFMGAGMDDQVTLENACFVPSGSVQMGSYIYDDPGPDDPRLLPLGEVPAIVYSEAMGDLRAISGKGEAEPAAG